MDSGCNCKRLIIFLCLASFLLLIHHVQSQNIYFPPKLCSITGNYTSNDQFKANRDALLLSLISNGTNGGYFNNTVGSSPDTIYGLVDCRGDISKKICYDCLVKIMEAPQVCPNDTSVAFRSEYCILHYSNTRFFDQVDKTFYRIASVYDVIIDPRYYYYGARLQVLLNNLTTSASRAQLRYSTAIASYTNSINIYGLAQCTRDLSHQNCFSCLNDMASWIPDNCKNTTQCWVYSTTCYIRYAQHQFYGPHLQSPPPQPSPNKIEENDGNKKVKSIVVIVVPIIGGAFVICAIITWRRKNRGERRPQQNHGPHDISESLHFELDTIRTATNDFSNSNKLGHGGFGEVYKGELPDGIEVAVKRLSVNSGQGSQEFRNEVVLLYRFLHRNLVKLLGYCSTEEEKLLIYEYVPNRSLDKYLFDPIQKASLDWGKRYNIIKGIARGLLYLHEDSRLRIIHRDLKAGNILLDRGMNALIADFGTARLFGVDQTHGDTNKIAGTFVYMAPEYAHSGAYSIKSDVFSFGVLVLEIITGQSACSFHQSDFSRHLTCNVWRRWRDGNALDMMDPTLRDNFLENEVQKCICIGLLCVQENIDVRPTMSAVLQMLNIHSLPQETPAPPPYMLGDTTPDNLRRDVELNDSSHLLSCSNDISYDFPK